MTRPPERTIALAPLFWILCSPIIFVFPGLLPARLVTGRLWSGWTLVWALLFSVVLLPPLCFGLAILLQTTINPHLVLPVAIVLGIPGVFLPRKR